MKAVAAVAEILKREGTTFLIGYPVNPIIEAAGQATAAMLGTRLKTHQTGPEGLPVHQVFVEEGSKIAREL